MSYWTVVEEVDPVTMEFLLENGEEMAAPKSTAAPTATIAAVEEQEGASSNPRRRFRCGCITVREGGAVHLCAYHDGFDRGVRRMREITAVEKAQE